MQMMSS
jgi:hypothetical protein